MYVCVYICTYIYIHTHTQTYIYMERADNQDLNKNVKNQEM